MSWSDNYLRDLVEIGGQALQKEDQDVQLLHRPDERQCQGIIHRALRRKFSYKVDTEAGGRFDFVVYSDNDEEIAKGEMKTWFSSKGESEIPRMINDLNKLTASGIPGFFLVVTASDQDHADWLADRLSPYGARLVANYSFSSIGNRRIPVDFYLLVTVH